MISSSASNLEIIEYSERDRRDPRGHVKHFQCPAPGYDRVLRTCRRRGCPRCGKPWANDIRRNTAIALNHYGGAVVMVTITAPGQERLPWDEAHCGHRRPHKHRGPSGCRVVQRDAREWSDSLSYRWGMLRGATRLATRRELADEFGNLGPGPAILERAYEPQKRGVPHLHVILGYRTREERDAAHVWVKHVKRLVDKHDFGFADGRGKKRSVRSRTVVERHGIELRPLNGEDAARYIANYLTGRNSKKKSSIRDNIADPNLPTSLVWVTPALTSRSENERIVAMRERLGLKYGTGVNMRWLRKARHLWAAIEGLVPAPEWVRMEDAIFTVSVFLQAYRKRPPPRDLAPALDLAHRIDRRLIGLGRAHYQPQITKWAFELVEACMPSDGPKAVVA